jgi:chromosome segregation ATPase
VEQARQQLTSGAADFRVKFMAERAAKIEVERRTELARQAMEFRQAEVTRMAELERNAQELQREAARLKTVNKGPDLSR